MKKHFPKKRYLITCVDSKLEYKETIKSFCPSCSESLLIAEPCRTNRYGYRCPICKKGFTYRKNRGEYKEYLIIFSKIYDQDNKIRWNIGLSEWFFLGRDKPIYKKYYYKVIYNRDSKQLYFFTKTPKGKRTKVSPISNGAIANWVNKEHLETIFKDKKYKDFINKIKKELPKWMYDKEIDIYNLVSLIKYPALMNLPHLSHFPLGRCTRSASPLIKSKLLNCEYGIYDFFQGLHGFKPNKSEIKMITKDSLSLLIYPILKRIVSDSNHIVEILKNINERLYVDYSYLSSFYFRYFLNPKCRMKEGNILIPLKTIRNLYESERLFVKAMINTIRKNDTFEYLEMYIRDSGRYLNHLQLEDIYEEFKNASDFEFIHDELIGRGSYIRLKGVEFSYSQTDILRFEKEMKGFEFILPRTGKELYKVHQKLKICVDLYDEYISEGEGYLIFMKNTSEDKIEYCLEINDKNQLKQAKAYCNQYPNRNVANIIAQYCKGIRVSIATNDLSSYESLSVR